MRRVIAKLILYKYKKVEGEIDIDSKSFMHLRFDEKLEKLKDYLLQFLCKNSKV